MGIGFSTMKKLMASSTDLPISDKAVHVMIESVEQHIKLKTKESATLHKEMNKLRGVQGIYQKKKISHDIVKTVMESNFHEQ